MGQSKDRQPPDNFISTEQGFADRKFDIALQYLLEHNVILGYVVIRRNSVIDREGIDRLVVLPSGLVAAIQIKAKNSRHNFQKELQRHLRIHPLIVCIFGIEKRHHTRYLARRIVRKINRMIRKTREIGFEQKPSKPTLTPP